MAERRRGFSLRQQLKELTTVGGLWVFGLFLILSAGLQNAISLEILFLDPAFLAKKPWYTGLVSNLGVLLWTVSTSAAFVGAWVANLMNRKSASVFLFVGSFVTMILLLDDLLQVHSVILPKLGLPKFPAQILIIFPVVLWLVVFRSDIQRTRWMFILVALGTFAVSLLIDFGLGLQGPNSLLIEDGGKFIGTMIWAQYFVVTTKDIIHSSVKGPSFVEPKVKSSSMV